jgi:hypothetical protein
MAAMNALVVDDNTFAATYRWPHNAMLAPMNGLSFLGSSTIAPDHEIDDGSCSIGTLLRIVHVNRRMEPMLMSNTNRRNDQRRAVEKSFTRMFLFSDPTMPQRCFTIFEAQQYNEKVTWRKNVTNHPNITVGDSFLILEPATSYHCEGDLVVMQTNFFPLTPINSPSYSHFYSPPSIAGKVESFCLPPATVRFEKTVVVESKYMLAPSVTGRMLKPIGAVVTIRIPIGLDVSFSRSRSTPR